MFKSIYILVSVLSATFINATTTFRNSREDKPIFLSVTTTNPSESFYNHKLESSKTVTLHHPIVQFSVAESADENAKGDDFYIGTPSTAITHTAHKTHIIPSGTQEYGRLTNPERLSTIVQISGAPTLKRLSRRFRVMLNDQDLSDYGS